MGDAKTLALQASGAQQLADNSEVHLMQTTFNN
jgi:hypothetical protein